MAKHQDPSFLDLSDPERQDWAALPVTRLYLKRLEDLRQLLLEESAAASLRGASSTASSHAGAFDIVDTLITEITEERQTQAPQTQDTTFVDPARRRSAQNV